MLHLLLLPFAPVQTMIEWFPIWCRTFHSLNQTSSLSYFPLFPQLFLKPKFLKISKSWALFMAVSSLSIQILQPLLISLFPDFISFKKCADLYFLFLSFALWDCSALDDILVTCRIQRCFSSQHIESSLLIISGNSHTAVSSKGTVRRFQFKHTTYLMKAFLFQPYFAVWPHNGSYLVSGDKDIMSAQHSMQK